LSYIFPASAHLILGASLGVPLWAGLMIFCWMVLYYQRLLRLVPVRCPSLIIRILVLIEIIGYFIRPLALCIRLIANIVAGHLLISLLGDLGLGFLVFQSCLMGFEVCVSLVQAYVFCILLYIYWWEI
jgi:F-type H+-transporting ATPase subunit a